MKNVAVIGGGPAGLMAAEVLASSDGLNVHLFEAKPSVGRKFLIAGKGGLNLTHAEPFVQFVERFSPEYGTIRKWLESFGPEELREWSRELGVETFVGPSGRVFPVGLKAFPLLQRWLQRLRSAGVTFHTRHRWLGWNSERDLIFSTPTGREIFQADATILALGGASWPKLGSDGQWVKIIQEQGVQVADLKPANCGFNVEWSEYFRKKFAGEPLKSVATSFTDSLGKIHCSRGSCVITEYGLESGVIYAVSAPLRDEILRQGSAVIVLDLLPDLDIHTVVQKLHKPRGAQTLTNVLRKQFKLKGVETGLLYEFARGSMETPEQIATALKQLKIPLHSTRPIVEAISTAGGVGIEDLDDRLMSNTCPGLFFAGEMLDWEAPTGGYLLTACFASGRTAALGVRTWLEQN